MDRKAEAARLTSLTESTMVFGKSTATHIFKGQPIHTKLSHTIRSVILDPPLQRYIQQKEVWDDDTFDAVDWTAFEASMKKLTVHKGINMAKYIFNWQNTGHQKQLFEDSQAESEGREPAWVGLCPMGCGEVETPKHFLQCTVLHNAKIMSRDLAGVRKWTKQKTLKCKLSKKKALLFV